MKTSGSPPDLITGGIFFFLRDRGEGESGGAGSGARSAGIALGQTEITTLWGRRNHYEFIESDHPPGDAGGP